MVKLPLQILQSRLASKTNVFFFGSEISQTTTKFIRSRQLKFRQKCINNFLSYPVDRQTDRQTDKGKSITFFVDVIACQYVN